LRQCSGSLSLPWLVGACGASGMPPIKEEAKSPNGGGRRRAVAPAIDLLHPPLVFPRGCLPAWPPRIFQRHYWCKEGGLSDLSGLRRTAKSWGGTRYSMFASSLLRSNTAFPSQQSRLNLSLDKCPGGPLRSRGRSYRRT
jgi:hypothetical protein